MGFVALGLAMIVILLGCAGLVVMFLRLTRRHSQQEPYFQFEDDRIPNLKALSQVQEDPEGEAAGAESTVEKSREA